MYCDLSLLPNLQWSGQLRYWLNDKVIKSRKSIILAWPKFKTRPFVSSISREINNMWQTSSQNRSQQDWKGFQSHRLRNEWPILQIYLDWRLPGGYPEATRGLPGDSDLIHVNKNDYKSGIRWSRTFWPTEEITNYNLLRNYVLQTREFRTYFLQTVNKSRRKPKTPNKVPNVKDQRPLWFRGNMLGSTKDTVH